MKNIRNCLEVVLEQFIEKHSNKYDYSLVEYVNSHTKIKIICKKHNFIFEQRPYCHKQGQGCPICRYEKSSLKRRMSLEQFIEKANETHSFFYNYSLVRIIKNSREKTNIICPKHGKFKQTIEAHLQGHGCPKCGVEKRSSKTKLTNEEFLTRANKKHDNKYFYPEKYTNNRTKITIKCPYHGEFKQMPNYHLLGQGCMECSGKQKLTHEEFLTRANKKHNNKYFYPEKYINMNTKIKIACNFHGNFYQQPMHHLNGSGCPKCSSKQSKGQNNFTNTLKEKSGRKIMPEEKKGKYKVDIFIPEKNIIVEYYGDYWHCNPKKYKPDYYHPHKKMHAKEIWVQDKQRVKYLKKLGYKIYVVWEFDWKRHREIVLNKYLKLLCN